MEEIEVKASARLTASPGSCSHLPPEPRGLATIEVIYVDNLP